MALLAVVMALSVPSLARFFRQRYLEEEAARLLALTEYGRNEAVSQGVPMILWINPETQSYGLEPRQGFPANYNRLRIYTLHPDIEFDLGTVANARNQLVEAAEFAPDGFLELHSLDALWLVDRQGRELVVAQNTNRWGYEVLLPADYAARPPRS